MRHKDKVIIITGSSMGIGKVMALEMLKQGAKVVLNARNPERLNKTYQELKTAGHPVIAVAGDVSNIEDCKRIVTETLSAFGKIDALVNNAGISMEGEVTELSPDVFRKVMEVNYLGSVYPTQAVLPELKKTKGSVIFMSSAAGVRGLPGYSVYSSSKMALTALAESMKIELYPSGVHVGIAYVGFTQNDPDKTIYNADGEIIAQPIRTFIKAEPPINVATRVSKMISSRPFKQVFTPLGKLNAIVNRWAPSLGEWILRRNYFKRKAEINAD
ncbi:MAG: NAD(P)-dependent dehydrogenase (short-subunit alcohol dehydrogenase family) [Polaribacter sp.]|jgi:NAD(P)-dependent dehydrogenase (short-subunit alcohol dehydrogenase family)